MGNIVMPKLSEAMSEGTILRWIKVEGDSIRSGDELVEIEVDGDEHSFPAPESGTLAEVLALEGSTLAVDELIARIEAPDGMNKVKASPLVQRIAREMGIQLAGDPPLEDRDGDDDGGVSGPADAEIPEADAATEPATPSAPSAPAAPPAPAAAQTQSSKARGEVTIAELNRSQQTVARRMAESKATAPHFYLQANADVTTLAERRRRAEAETGTADPLPTLNDTLIRACALALADHPKLNGAYRDAKAEAYERVNVGIAISVDDSLLVPTIFDADRKDLSEIAAETAELVARAKQRKITPPQLSGGTFTITNLGVAGVDSMVAILNPPQAATLAVGSIEDQPVVRNGEVVGGKVMSLTLSCDHRLLYGVEAAEFLAHLRRLLEDPDPGLIP